MGKTSWNAVKNKARLFLLARLLDWGRFFVVVVRARVC